MRFLICATLLLFAAALCACTSGEGATPTATPTPGGATPVPKRPSYPGSLSFAISSPGPSAAPTVSPTPIPLFHEPPYTVALEAGHGGPYYFGATGRDGDGNVWIEKDVTLDLARRVQSKLVELGYNTVMLRDGDTTLTPFSPYDYRGSMIAEAQARVDVANESQADAYVAMHFNGWSDGSQSGTETYCNPDRSFGYQSCGLAYYVQDALVRWMHDHGYDTHDRGVKNDSDVNGDAANEHSYALGTNRNFRPSLMPGVIIESLFMTNAADLDFVRGEDGLDIIANAVTEGIDSYFKWLQLAE